MLLPVYILTDMAPQLTIFCILVGSIPLCCDHIVIFIAVLKHDIYYQQVCQDFIFELLGDMFYCCTVHYGIYILFTHQQRHFITLGKI